MNKKVIIGIVAAVVVVAVILGIVFSIGGNKEGSTGKNKEVKIETETISFDYTGYPQYKISINVPIEKGYSFTEGRPEEYKEDLSSDTSYVLIGDKVIIGFHNDTYSTYNTSTKYKDKYGEKEASFANYKEFIYDKEMGSTISNMNPTDAKIGEFDAIRYDMKELGVAGTNKFHGYGFIVDMSSIFSKSSGLELEVIPVNKEVTPEDLIADPKVKVILESIKVEKAQ